MPIFKIDAAALCIAHNFIDEKSCNTETGFVFIEKYGANDVRMTGMEGHMLICFRLHNANPSGLDFQPFGFRVDSAALKMLKPKKDKTAFINLAADDSGVELEANGMTIKAEMTLHPFDVSAIWERVRRNVEKGCDFAPSVLPLKQLKICDFSGFFSGSTRPAFIKANSMTIVNFQGLPEHLEARGIVMQMREGCKPEDYAETFGEDVPDWC